MKFVKHLRWIVSGLLIVYILHNVNISEIVAIAQSANLLLLLITCLLHFVGYYLSANRWRTLIQAQGRDVPLPSLFKSCMVSTFFNNFLPSTIGGDVVRAYDSWRFGTSKSGAVAVIFVDRFLGILTLMLIAVITLLISKQLIGSFQSLYPWVLFVTFGLLLILWLIFVPPRQMIGRLTELQLSWAPHVQSSLHSIASAFLVFQGNKKALLRALGLSLILQINVIIHYYLIGVALNFPVSLWDFFLIVPPALFIMMVPISINAIGVRENIFAFFFAVFGVSKPEAVAFAWLAYGTLILQGIFGGVVYALRKQY